MTRDLADRFATPLPGDGGHAWQTLVAAHGYTSVKAIEVADAGGGTAYKTVRAERVTVTRHARRGKQIGKRDTFLVMVTLVRETTRQPWRVSTTSVTG